MADKEQRQKPQGEERQEGQGGWSMMGKKYEPEFGEAARRQHE